MDPNNKPSILFLFLACLFFCLFVFLLFLCESNSNLLTQSQRALSSSMLIRYSIKSLCYNPSSVLIAFYRIINFFFQILHPTAYRRVQFLNIFLMLFAKCVDFLCLTNDKFSHSLEFELNEKFSFIESIDKTEINLLCRSTTPMWVWWMLQNLCKMRAGQKSKLITYILSCITSVICFLLLHFQCSAIYCNSTR